MQVGDDDADGVLATAVPVGRLRGTGDEVPRKVCRLDSVRARMYNEFLPVS